MLVLLALVMVLGRLGAEPIASVDLQKQMRIEQWIGQLRSDHERFNAHQASIHLLEIGREAIGPLTGALQSTDHQQRHMAAEALLAMCSPWHDDPVPIEPTPPLMRVLVEGLRNDDLPHGSDGGEPRYNYVYNARFSTEYMARHPDAAAPLLGEALRSDDGQQQFLAACLLGWAGHHEYVDDIAAILLPHLRDNRIMCDALLAAAALYRLGPAVVPHLQRARQTADAQQRKFIDLILLDLRDPPTTGAKLQARKHRFRLAQFCYDPVHQFDIDSLYQYPFDWPGGMPRVNLSQ